MRRGRSLSVRSRGVSSGAWGIRIEHCGSQERSAEPGEILLRICLLTYRGNPTCGGQGVYIKYLSRALKELGHEVDVLSGPPIRSSMKASLCTRFPVWIFTTPTTFSRSKRSANFPLRSISSNSSACVRGDFRNPSPSDSAPAAICAGAGTDMISSTTTRASPTVCSASPQSGYPTVATIHHPITVDRDTEIGAAGSWLRRMKVRRWYSFLTMQKRVSRRISNIITVSECSKRDIGREFRLPAERFRVVPNGINTDCFYPLNGVKRADHQILVTNSADTPLKGLRYLLEAVAEIRRERAIRVVVIGKPKDGWGDRTAGRGTFPGRYGPIYRADPP